MAKKPRRDEVLKIVKELLDSEIPEIQGVAKQLADRIRQLEEHSLKLQKYFSQIEELATEESNAIVEAKLGDLIKDVDKALGDLRRKPRGAVSPPEAGAGVEEGVEAEEAGGEREEAGSESGGPPSGMALETFTTPEGYVVKKSRR